MKWYLVSSTASTLYIFSKGVTEYLRHHSSQLQTQKGESPFTNGKRSAALPGVEDHDVNFCDRLQEAFLTQVNAIQCAPSDTLCLSVDWSNRRYNERQVCVQRSKLKIRCDNQILQQSRVPHRLSLQRVSISLDTIAEFFVIESRIGHPKNLARTRPRTVGRRVELLGYECCFFR